MSNFQKYCAFHKHLQGGVARVSNCPTGKYKIQALEGRGFFLVLGAIFFHVEAIILPIWSRVGVKYSIWYMYFSTYLSVLEYLVYGNVKVLVLDQKVLGT